MTHEASRDPDDLPPGLRFLAGGGAATRLILARDWKTHPMGPPQDWPASFKATLSTVLNSPESMILCWGAHDLHFFFNETYFPLLGPRLDRAMGAPFRDVWADAWEQAGPIIADAFAGRSRRFDDLPWKLDTDRGQADTWFTFSYSRVLDEHGEVAGLFVFTNETTERVLADAALRESEEQLRLVIEGARDHAIFTTDSAGTINSWSPGACLIFGWTPEEAIGRPAAIIFTPEDRAAGADRLELDAAARDGCAADERWHLTKSGTRVFMNGSVHPLPHDAQGQPRGFLKVARDETERFRTRQALELLNATLEQQVADRTADRNLLWRLSSDVQLVARADGTIEAVNPAWTRMLGWAEDELVGRSIFDLVHPDDVPATVAAATAVGRGDSYNRFENRYRHRDGSYRVVEWSAGPGDGRIVAVGRDVTEDRARAAALAQAENQLRQAQKMEAVGQLTGGIAHDFNNMLTGVIGSLDLLNRHLAEGRTDRVGRYIDAATTSAQRAAGLTQRLLAFSRRQSLDVQPVDVGQVVVGMEDLLRRTLGEQVGLEIRLAADTGVALTDANQLESALLNLAINARDAMPDGGLLTVETAATRLDPGDIDALEAVDAGDYVVISVSDTGTGMTPDIVAKAFDPFFTTKPIGQGTGLGLSMIYGFARQTGGQARIYSEAGRGTTVRLYLKRHAGDALVPVDAATGAMQGGRGEQVLVVEDEPAVRMLVVEVLEDLGYRVLEAADGRQALKLIDTEPAIDLLVTDVGLPGMNGRQLAEQVRDRLPGLKVLFVTGYAEGAAVRSGFLDAGMDMISKPFAIDALATKIREMLA